MPPMDDLSVSSAMDALSDVPLSAPKAEDPADIEGPIDDEDDDGSDNSADDGDTDSADEDTSTSDDDDEDGPERATDDVEASEDASDKGEQEAVPAIDPPAALALDDKQREAFKTLPRVAQEILIEHDKRLIADHTRKTQEVAEKRKAYEAGLDRLKDVRTKKEERIEKWKKVDWVTLARTMPEREYNANRAQYEKELGEHQALQTRVAQEEQNSLNLHDREQVSTLKKLAPQLLNGEEGKKLRTEVFDAVEAAGIPRETARLISAAEMVFVHEALQWRKYQAEKSKKPNITEMKIANKPGRNVTPAPRTSSASAPRVAAEKSFKRDPSAANARRALMNLPD